MMTMNTTTMKGRNALAIRYYVSPRRQTQVTKLLLCSARQHCRPQLASSFSTSSAKPPTNTTWERSAKLVKNTDVTNPYLDQIRAETVDPALQLKSIEDELCGAIGKALGRQGEKILSAIREMTNEHVQYQKFIDDQAFQQALQSAEKFNYARKRAVKARWELLVHRQAVGLTVDNHRVVHETFPIPEKLPDTISELEESLDGRSAELEKVAEPAKKQFGDQLDWWQNVGRWK